MRMILSFSLYKMDAEILWFQGVISAPVASASIFGITILAPVERIAAVNACGSDMSTVSALWATC